nr:lipoate--protein ligase family protein [Bifidobacterium callitrichos]
MKVVDVHIDGDFFVDAPTDAMADALIADIEESLESVAGESVASEVPEALVASIERAIARHPQTRLVGCDADAIATAFRRAIGQADERASERVDERTAVQSNGLPSDGLPSNDRLTADRATMAHSHAGAVQPVRSESDMPQKPADPGHEDPGYEDTEDAEFARRWTRLLPELALVHDIPRSPAEQMRIDEQWAREVADGTRRPTLRIWEWSGPCVVVGRFQSIPDEVHEDVARAEGIAVVRRSTGGGAMFIEPGNTITYSLYAPLWFVDGIDVAASYRLCDRWLIRALAGLGLDVRFAGLNDIASSHGKIGGAAQRRFPGVPRSSSRSGAPGRSGVPGQSRGPGAVLHHVTMAYDIDARKMARVLNTSAEKMSDKAVRSAVKRVDPLRSQTGMTRDEIVDHLLDSLRGAVQ